MQRLLVLDRDGVINHDSPDYIKTPDEWRAIDGSPEGIALLTAAGFTVAVATNQSGVGRGLFDEATLAAIHQKMVDSVARVGGRIDGIFYCPHAPDAGCDCRKPGTGLFDQIAAHFGLPLAGVPAIGDSMRDMQAAESAGARPVLVLTGNGQRTAAALADSGKTVDTHADLAAAARAIVDDSRGVAS